MDVAAWLRGLGLGQYAELFARHGFDATALARLSASDLKALGVGELSHRKRLLAAIARLGSGERGFFRLPESDLPP